MILNGKKYAFVTQYGDAAVYRCISDPVDEIVVEDGVIAATKIKRDRDQIITRAEKREQKRIAEREAARAARIARRNVRQKEQALKANQEKKQAVKDNGC